MEDNKKEILFNYELLSKLIVGIGEVSKITGIPTRKLRYWEEKKIIQSENSENDGETRRYNYKNIKKIILIKELLDEGYTLEAASQKVSDRIDNLDSTFSKLIK